MAQAALRVVSKEQNNDRKRALEAALSQIVLPFNLTNDTDADADQVMANYTAITGVSNGSLEAGVNVRVGTAGAISSGSGL